MGEAIKLRDITTNILFKLLLTPIKIIKGISRLKIALLMYFI